ncbi:MAG: ribosome maturation factor RimM [Candidatus Abyssubacteria bacterium]
MSSDERDGGRKESPDDTDVVIGKVVSVNVPRRELRITPETSHPERFHNLHDLRLSIGNRAIVFELEKVRVTKSFVIAHVVTQDDELVSKARGANVVVSRSQRFRLPENEYYIDDLIGLIVKDTNGNVVGRISEVWNTPANDIYRVVNDDGEEILLPAIEEVIIEVAIEAGVMTANTSLLG